MAPPWRKSSTRFSSSVENQDELYSLAETPLKDSGHCTSKIHQNCKARLLGYMAAAHHEILINPGRC